MGFLERCANDRANKISGFRSMVVSFLQMHAARSGNYICKPSCELFGILGRHVSVSPGQFKFPMYDLL